jgi:hypothetical protein
MPIKPCKIDGKPGYKWGDNGKCYLYKTGDDNSKKRAKEKALKQARAIKARK